MKKSYLIICGKFYDGKTDEIKSNIEILVEGNIIVQVGKNLSRPKDVEIIDLSHLTITPGMIDAHVHTDILRWQELSALFMNSPTWGHLSSLHTVQRTLERGFTTIRAHAIGDPEFGTIAVREAIKQGIFSGSRMLVACHLLGTEGSHADISQFLSSNPRLCDAAQLPTIGSGVDFFRRAVRREVKFGADFIKLFMNGGFSTPNDGPEDIQLCDDEIEAIIGTARQLGKTTTAHVYTPESMNKLMDHGITGMEHGAMMDEETARRFEETDTYLVPTFCPYNEIIDINEADLSKKSPEFQAKLREYAVRLREGRKIIVNSKIRLGYGTDFVTVHQPYESWYEFKSWSRAGMDHFRILKAATSVNAGILGIDQYIGTIEPGKLADIAGWHRDLLGDEDALSECDFVMKDGIVYPTVGPVSASL